MGAYHARMGRIWQAWWRRHRSNRQARFFAQHRLNRASWRQYPDIQNLAYPPCKRLLFEGERETAVGSFEPK
jgi:hypothetical protein